MALDVKMGTDLTALLDAIYLTLTQTAQTLGASADYVHGFCACLDAVALAVGCPAVYSAKLPQGGPAQVITSHRESRPAELPQVDEFARDHLAGFLSRRDQVRSLKKRG